MILQKSPRTVIHLGGMTIVIMIESLHLNNLNGKVLSPEFVPRFSNRIQGKVLVSSSNPDGDWNFPRRSLNHSFVIPHQSARVHGNGSEVVRFQERKVQGVYGARRMTKKVKAPWIHKNLVLNELNKIPNELRRILLRTPLGGVGGVGCKENNPFACSQSAPRLG